MIKMSKSEFYKARSIARTEWWLDLPPKNWTKTNVKNLLESTLHNQEDL
jgi:hypothetical protein